MDSGDRVIIRDESFPALLGEELLLLKPGLSSDSCDAILCCGHGLEVPVHKLVLAAISDFLSDVLKDHEVSSGEELTATRIVLEDMSLEVLKLVVEFAYTGEATIPAPMADDIFEAAQRLGIKFLRDSFVRLDHDDYEDVRAGRKRLDLTTQQALPNEAEQPVLIDHSSSDTESAESNDLGDTSRLTPGPRFQVKKKKKSSATAETSASENVMFTITKHGEQEVQPYLVRFENGEPHRSQQPVRQLQVMKGKLPNAMQVLLPKTASAASPQPRLEARQIMTLRRPDGTLVQFVAQRSKQQQQIIAPKLPGQPRKMCLPKGVQLQPKVAATRDALAIAVESMMANPHSSLHRHPDVQVVATSPMNQVVATLRTPQTQLRRPQMSPIVRQPVSTVRQAVATIRQPVSSVRQAVASIRQPVSSVRQPLRQSPSFSITSLRKPLLTSTPNAARLTSTIQSPSTISTFLQNTEPRNLSKIFTSPSKLSAPLTVSDPKPTIPSTVPDDFLEDSSETTLSDVGTTDVMVSSIEPVTWQQNADSNNEDQSTRRSARERKINRKYLDDETEGSETTSSIEIKQVTESSEIIIESPEPKANSSDNKRKADDDDLQISPAQKISKFEKISEIKKDESKDIESAIELIQTKAETDTEKSKSKENLEVKKPVKKDAKQQSKESNSNPKKPAASVPENSRRSASKLVETGSARSSSSNDRLSRSKTRHVISSKTRSVPCRKQREGKNNKNVVEKRSLRNSKRK